MELFSRSHFNEISEKENIIKIIHRHWFDIFQQFLIIVAVMMVLVSGFFIFPGIFAGSNNPNFYALLVFLESVFALLVWVYAFLIWVDYYFDMWIITSDRIVNIEQKGLFLRAVSELKYNKIQDVTVDVRGFFPTVLNYGDVQIQTAGEQGKFLFRHIPDPYGTKNIIMELQKQQEKEKVSEIGEMIEKMKAS